MTETPRPIDPDDVDELLSADLDGELDVAARDLGYEPAAVRAALAAEPELRDRRDALERARAELARVPELDEVSQARLRATALGGAERRSPHRARLFAVSSGLAAAVAIVVAVVAISHSTHDTANTRAASTPARGGVVAQPTPSSSRTVAGVDFGTVANIDTLVTRAATFDAEQSSTNAASGTTTVNAGDSASATGAGTLGAKAAPACRVEAQLLAGGGATLLVSGAATLDDRLVTVSIFARTGKANVLVVLDRDCKLVGTRNVPTPPPSP